MRRALFLAAAATTAAVLVFALPASAHTLGLSESDLEIETSGAVHGRIAIPALELSALAPVDRDGDGRIGQAEIDAERTHFERLALGLIELRADTTLCTAALQRTVVGPENDGVDLFVEYTCPPHPIHVEVQALLLSALPLSHRHTLRIRAGSQQVVSALGGPLRRADLATGFSPAPSGNRVLAWGVMGALVAVVLGLAWRRRVGA